MKLAISKLRICEVRKCTPNQRVFQKHNLEGVSNFIEEETNIAGTTPKGASNAGRFLGEKI
jgi:hypothetical protein